MRYAIIILSLALFSSIAYAFTSSETLFERVERENRETLIECLDEASRKSTTEEVLQAKNTCSESILTKIIAPTNTGTHSTGTTVLPPKGLNASSAQKKQNPSIPLIKDSAKIVGTEPLQKNQEEPTNFWKVYDIAIPLIRKYEGLSLKAYPDPVKCSIGYGTRAKSCSEVITQAEADKRLGSIVKQVVTRVQRDFPTLNPKQQAGLVSFAFNCHDGYTDVKKRGLDKHKYWCKSASGKKLQGLVNRRLEEQILIFN